MQTSYLLFHDSTLLLACSLNVERFAQEAFEKDSRIRYVGIIGENFRVLYSQMRKGLQSVPEEEPERNMLVMPPIILEAAEKLNPLLGKLDNVTARYQKLLLVFFRVNNLTIVLSFDPNVSTPFISALSETVRTITTRYLESDSLASANRTFLRGDTSNSISCCLLS